MILLKNCKDCKSCVEYTNVKDGLLLYNCSDCNKNYEYMDSWKRFNETSLPDKK